MPRTNSKTPAAYRARARRSFATAAKCMTAAREIKRRHSPSEDRTRLIAGYVTLARSYARSGRWYRDSARHAAFMAKHAPSLSTR